MTSDPRKQALRLQKRHEPDPEPPPDLTIGQRLWDAQSLRNALIAGLITLFAYTLIWVMLSTLFNRVFPWMTLLLGMLVGLATRRAGLGLSWPFPVLAASLTALGALLSGLVVAAALIASELNANLFSVFADLSQWWSLFIVESMTPADVVYAVAAAGIAAFFSMRRLGRRQYLALRLWKQSSEFGR